MRDRRTTLAAASAAVAAAAVGRPARAAPAYALRIEKDVPVPMRDGATLRADVFRPDAPGRFPIIMTHGPYPKDAHFRDWAPREYAHVAEQGPHMHWETPNPEWWVPHGYVQVRVDQRGTGASPGTLGLFDPQQGLDYFDAIEWAARQPWSTGRVGLLGISYFAIGQWQVAALRPPSLAAIVPWEGANDLYRDVARHGGILSDRFAGSWYARRILPAQHGRGRLPGAELAALRAHELPEEFRRRPLLDAFYRDRTPELGRIEVPLLSVGNWGGQGLHLRGNVEGHARAGSAHKRLVLATGSHVGLFYEEAGRAMQKRFLDRWVAGIANGAEDDAPVLLAVRRGGDAFTWREERAWPLPRTRWTDLHLDVGARALRPDASAEPGDVPFPAADGAGGAVRFATPPLPRDTEVTGPVALRIWLSSAAGGDADLFVVLRNLGPDGREVTETGANEPGRPVTQGWLRASHRALDTERSLPWRPWHPHDAEAPLPAGEPVPLDVEIWPTSMVFAAGHRIALDVAPADADGSAMFRHDDPTDRRAAGAHRLHAGGRFDSRLRLPVIA